MADNHTSSQRSYNMSRIRSIETKPEILVRRFLFSQGFRFRKNDKRYPGTPDIVLPKYKTVVFVNGCFWHKHNCNAFVIPKTNTDYWMKKISRNVERDQENYSKLRKMGWKVIVVWECELKKPLFESRMDSLCHQILEE